MCGIVGVIGGDGSDSFLRTGLDALKRLEYRGYDSAGLAYWDGSQKRIIAVKSTGKIVNLERKIALDSPSLPNPIILHTRWATHGKITEANTHPHGDCSHRIWVAHNGIIENYRLLKEQLERDGHKFASETDSEVIAHLIETYFDGNLEEAVRRALAHCIGTYGLVVIAQDDPEKIVAARLSSPLLIGLGENQFIVTSDPSSINGKTKKAIYLDDGETAVIKKDKLTVITEKRPQEIDWVGTDCGRGHYPHFMLKEIMEQPEAIENALRGRLVPGKGRVKLGGLNLVEKKLKIINKLHIVGCGTARHAGLVAEYLLEEYAGILTKTDVASEFRYRKPYLDFNSAVLAISQSGETADTLAAIREARAQGFLALGITNVVGSTLARETDAGVYTRAGPEIGVASTKAFTCQLVALVLMALLLGEQRSLSSTVMEKFTGELGRLTGLVARVLETDSQIKELAHKYKDFENFLYLGRKYNYPIAREGAHKIKETAYIHAEGCHGGEPKHCELALISESFPSICIAPNDSVYVKMIANIEEIKARSGPVIAITTEGNREMQELADDVIYIPEIIEPLTPLLTVIPLQLFAYHMGVLRGCDLDKPRNLAKSVTVE